MSNVLNTPGIAQLKTLLEEESRATEEGVRRFVEPTHGALNRAIAKRHHIVFGRRGSGKSSLLRRAAATLTVDRRPIAFVDVERFKGHSYPDVLISILIETFGEFEKWLNTAAINPATKTTFWQRTFGAKPSRPAFNREKAKQIAATLHKQIIILESQLHSSDGTSVQITTRRESELIEDSRAGITVTPQRVGLSTSAGRNYKDSAGEEVQETFAASKVDFIHRHILDYQRVFRQMAVLSGGDAYLFLDDLYHVRQGDQTRVLDYFHRLAKGNNLWLKVGTIRHRTRWYLHGDPPIGVKLGDDADEIDLDLTLEKFTLAKNFLTQILMGFLAECEDISIKSILVDEALTRLVLASGGVARDFLGIFRRSIDIARERGNDHRGERITTEDVNNAAGEYDLSKREELKRDTIDERTQLETALDNVRCFCLYRANANVFLLNKDLRDQDMTNIQELVDLRLLHKIKSRVTVWKREGQLYEAYMLDISQYTGSRAKRNLDIIEFWKEARPSGELGPRSEDLLRRPGLIYNPAETYTSLERGLTTPKDKDVERSELDRIEQPRLL